MCIALQLPSVVTTDSFMGYNIRCVGVISREQFLVFHRDGYTVYDPLRCLLKHTVSASFSRLPLPVTGGSRVLCEGGKCEWSGAVNVRDRLVYVAQPTLNRVLVLDMDELGNVLEVGWALG